MIHNTAIINPKAKISSSVEIGPYSIIGPDVEINNGSIIHSHVNISGHTVIGMNNKIYPFASLGSEPQDMKYKGEKTKLLIGDNSGDPTVATLTGTSNQVTVTNGAGSITLSTPQDLDTSADVTFDSVILHDLTATRLVATNGSKKLVSSDLNNWVAGTSNQISVADDSDGTITLSTPQNIHTGATPTFASLTTSGNVSGSAASTGSFGHLVVAKDAHIGEDLLADGDVVAYNSSDMRLKNNLQVIGGALDKIDGINGYEFDWNEQSPEWAQERGHDVGVVAQEIQKIHPEIVEERKNGYLGVDYKRLVPLLIQSVKELKQEVEELKKKV